MHKATLNLLIDLLAAIALTVLVATGYMLWFVLPPGTNRTHEVFGWLRHEWGELHFWIAAALLTVLAVHMALHWRWFSTGLCKRLGLSGLAQRRPAAAGVVALVIAAAPLAMVIIAAHARVSPLETPRHSIDDGSAQTPESESELTPAAREREVAHILSVRCASCHGAVAPAEGVRADTIASLLVEQHGVRWVTPAEAAASPLFKVLRAPSPGASRRRAHELPSSELFLLRAWAESLN